MYLTATILSKQLLGKNPIGVGLPNFETQASITRTPVYRVSVLMQCLSLNQKRRKITTEGTQ